MLYLWKYTFLHSIPLNKIVLEWAIYPIKPIKIDFNMVCIPPQNLAKSIKYKKSNKIVKNEKFEKIKKNKSRLCTKEHTCQIWWWSEHIKTEKIGDDEAWQTDRLFFHWLILGPRGLKCTQKNFWVDRRKSQTEAVCHNTPSGVRTYKNQ